MSQSTILAHGLGAEYLPLPYTYALIGGAWALTASFAIVAFAWKTPRLDPRTSGIGLPAAVTRLVDSRGVRAVVAGAALLFTVWVALAAVAGSDDPEINPLPGVFYVLLWVGLVVLSVLIGPVWRVISPVRTVARLLSTLPIGATARRAYPESWGHRPAAVGLAAFVWLELASPDPDSLIGIRIWLVVYVVAMAVGGLLTGTRWFARADPFETYGVVASRIAPFWRDESGRVVVGNPLAHLSTLPERPGMLAVMSVLLGSTAFDSFSSFPLWQRTIDDLGEGTAIASVVSTVTLAGFIAVVAVTFWAATRATGGVTPHQRRRLPVQMTHTLIPIVVGYILAHYLNYIVERSQLVFASLADPLDRGWNVLWLGDIHPEYVLSSHPTVSSTLKLVFVVGGHIAAVVAAHDASLRLLPRRHRLTGQLALMLTMVGYTFLGLYLLFGG
ncbi:hypothetical protein ASG12_04570 [Williamsia sp. Leaf354]|uniref:hypothetical protein n=1 Tax=Williamsia sp. Leaf354 TaxID=1736349 RepID=UPI0006F41CC6|nr:hypothetical protein [Williamsia sp. Leaf354]KQS00220.1 hypothetical protein ASG12_04570 [Williamsia sp. Leaf354]